MTEKETVEWQDKMIQLLEEILIWTRLQGVRNAKAVLEETLNDDKLKLAYHLSDGRSSAEVANACGVSGMTITNWWRRWFTMGIAQPSKRYKGRFERTFSLEDLGIRIPSIKVETRTGSEKQPKSEETPTTEGEPT